MTTAKKEKEKAGGQCYVVPVIKGTGDVCVIGR